MCVREVDIGRSTGKRETKMGEEKERRERERQRERERERKRDREREI